MKKKLYFWLLSSFVLSTSSFAMLTDDQYPINNTYNVKRSPTTNFVSPDLLNLLFPSKVRPVYDEKLSEIKGKNISNCPLTEEMYDFIIRRVGANNDKPFVFKNGPQIIFEDEIDLSR